MFDIANTLAAAAGTLWHDALALIPWWGWVIIWAIPGLAYLWVLVQAKQLAGWPGVFAVLGSTLYIVGWFRGRTGQPIIPGIDHSRPGPQGQVPTVAKQAPRPKGKRRWDPDLNRWVD